MQTQERMVNDVKIMQKVNRINREAFLDKYPGQIEHVLRLLCERLQMGLDKRDGVDVANPDTWRLSTSELADLSESIYHIHLIHKSFRE